MQTVGTDTPAVAMVITGVVGLAAIGYYVWKTWGILLVKLDIGTNGNRFAAQVFLRLLADAQSSMLICDDGNDMPESIYANREVCDEVESHLERNSEIRIYCLFHSNDRTRFVEKFSNHPQVAIRNANVRRDIHFKIIDGGAKAYVSSHPSGGVERRYKLYDCSKAPQRIRDVALGHHIRDMKAEFPGMAFG